MKNKFFCKKVVDIVFMKSYYIKQIKRIDKGVVENTYSVLCGAFFCSQLVGIKLLGLRDTKACGRNQLRIWEGNKSYVFYYGSE